MTDATLEDVPQRDARTLGRAAVGRSWSYAPGMSSSSIGGAGLARRIYERSHLTGAFRLRSGVVSDEYFDKYLFEADPVLLREVCDALIGTLPERVEAVAGLELGSIPLATVVSQRSGLPTLFVRKKAKDYGTCRLAEGGEVAARRLA